MTRAQRRFGVSAVVMGGVLIAGAERSLAANTLCVNPGGTYGCYSTIGAAVIAASPGDTIRVLPGFYREQVTIDRPLSLIGASAKSTIIDATNKDVGIYVDGMDNKGLSEVLVQGFTVASAKFEGILVTNASAVTILENHVTGNNRNLDTINHKCPGQPPWETSEDFDCGEGIHLVAVDHSVVAKNVVDHNSGGILLTDETGPTHDNLITGNLVTDNPIDCGITLASHRSADGSPPYGVFHNTVANNDSSNNGQHITGIGVGIGIFTSGAAPTKAYGNVVIGNRLTGNGHPGIALHSHKTDATLIENAIIGNYITGNGPDVGDAATSAPTGINIFGPSALTGTVVWGNIIDGQDIDIAISTPTQVEIHLNDLINSAVGVVNQGSGTVNATQNWWGCPLGPTAPGCAGAQGSGIIYAPSLVTKASDYDRPAKDSVSP